MVVQNSRPLVEPACVPRIVKPELLIIEMVAEFVTKGAHERAERRDFLPHCRSHPDADKRGFGV